MFAEMYTAAMRHLRPNDPGWAARGWLAEVEMHTGAVTRPWISSLSAFWPGLQALIGACLDKCGNQWYVVRGDCRLRLTCARRCHKPLGLIPGLGCWDWYALLDLMKQKAPTGNL